MPKILIIIMILVVGAVMLAPAIAVFNPDPLPGDFIFTWNNAHIVVPVFYSLCASLALGLFYLVMKR